MARAKGTTQLNVGVEVELAEAFKAFAEGRGQTLRHCLERAMRRDMANPPPLVPDPPLPDAPPEPAPKRKPAPKKR